MCVSTGGGQVKIGVGGKDTGAGFSLGRKGVGVGLRAGGAGVGAGLGVGKKGVGAGVGAGTKDVGVGVGLGVGTEGIGIGVVGGSAKDPKGIGLGISKRGEPGIGVGTGKGESFGAGGKTGIRAAAGIQRGATSPAVKASGAGVAAGRGATGYEVARESAVKGGKPPPIIYPDLRPVTGRNKELAIQTAKADVRRRAALSGRRRTILSKFWQLGIPSIEKKLLLGQ